MNSRRRAMSLIELTLVILVVGVLAAVAAPRFADALRVMKLDSAARQLAAHVDYIRSIAINEGRSTLLVCDNGLQAYACDGVDFPERPGEPLRVFLGKTYDPGMTLAADFDSQSTLRFDFEGVPHVGAFPLEKGSIVLTSGEDRFAVMIAAGTGATWVARGNAIDDTSGATGPVEDAGGLDSNGVSP